MAEAGLTIAIFGAFNTALQYFEYAYLAKNFDRDSETAQLKLDIAKLQLSRWGRSVGLDSVDETRPSLPPAISALPDECRTAEQLLMHINDLFKEVENKSAKLSPQQQSTSAYDPAADLDPSTASLHDRLNKLSLRNLKTKSILRRTKWTLYSEKHVRRLVEDITDEVNGLVKLFPATEPGQA